MSVLCTPFSWHGPRVYMYVNVVINQPIPSSHPNLDPKHIFISMLMQFDSFAVQGVGRSVAALFLQQRQHSGINMSSSNWRYSLQLDSPFISNPKWPFPCLTVQWQIPFRPTGRGPILPRYHTLPIVQPRGVLAVCDWFDLNNGNPIEAHPLLVGPIRASESSPS